MLVINRLQEVDLPAAPRLSTQAGWNQVKADWRRLLALWPGTCLAGRVAGQLIATATVALYGQLGWVGMILVDERHRGRGHGTAMLDAALAAGVDAGARAFGLDATDLGRPLYLKRGFRDVGRIDRWVLEPSASATSAPSPAWIRQKRRTPLGREWDALLRADRAAVGAVRAGLLDQLWNEGSAWVSVRAGDADAPVQGFAFARPGRLGDHVGPVIAEEGMAETVLDALIPAEAGEARLIMDVPRGQLAEWLQVRGWRLSRELWRMHTAPDQHPTLVGPRVFAAAGFELG